MPRILTLITFLIVLFFQKTLSQSIAPGSIRLEENMRDLQLLDKIPQEYSFTNRGYKMYDKLNLDSLYNWIDHKFYNAHKFYHNIIQKKWAKLVLIPIEFKQVYNSKTPFGYNDGSFIKSRGYQMDLTGGLYGKLGPIEFQAQPNFTYSQNRQYIFTSSYGSKTKGPISRKYPGQSDVSLNLGAISVGLSSENRWFGPGIRNSLMMSNNAPGFANAYFRTKKPLTTPIGSFEWSLLTGWLKEDSLYAFENYKMQPFSNRNRKMLYNGLIISHQPKWFRGMHVGLIRAYNTKNSSNFQSEIFKNSSFVDKYLPVFTVLTKSKIINTEDQKERDQQASIFMRWVSTKDHFEMYAEYGWNDHAVNMRDLAMGPGHSAAYLTGMKKIIPLRDLNEYFNFEIEYIRGQQLAEYLVRDAGNWNWHGDLQSFTNFNQFLGSAVGNGNNSIYFLSSYHKGWKKYSFSIEKIYNDPLYFQNNKWTDFITGFSTDQNLHGILMHAELKWVHQKNYGWESKNNLNNIFASLGLKYLL